MIELFFGFFAQGWVPWALSALILLAALVIWLDFRHQRLEPVLAGLDGAIRAIEDVGGASAFRARFSSLYRRLADNPVLGEGWRAYAPTLAPAPGSDDAMGYSRRPHENFNESLLAAAGVNLRFYHAVPNYLVGIGLFFTFLGLVAALYFASAGVTAADVTQAQGALRDLLAAATFKFVTSIAGLGASLVFSWAEKRQLYRVQRRLSQLCAALEERMVPVTPESLAATHLKELKIQSGHLRRIGRNIFVTVPEAIEERLAQELSEAMRPMRAALAEAARRLHHLDEVVAARIDGSGVALPAAAAPLLATAPSGAALEALIGETRAMRAALESLADGLPGAAMPLQRPETAAELQATLIGFVELFENAALGLETIDRRFADAVAGTARALEGLGARLGRGDEVEAALSVLRDGVEALGEARRELEVLGRAFREVAADSRATLDAGAAAGPLDPGLIASLERLSSGVQNFQGRMRAFVRRTEERLARTSRRVDDLAGELAGSGAAREDRRGR